MKKIFLLLVLMVSFANGILTEDNQAEKLM